MRVVIKMRLENGKKYLVQKHVLINKYHFLIKLSKL